MQWTHCKNSLWSKNICIFIVYQAVGHGGHYHSQSSEGYFAHTPGLIVVQPSNPISAKGLMLASIRSPNPVVFFEPKGLYRTAEAEVPVGDYEFELMKADVKQIKKVKLNNIYTIS